MFEFVPYKSFGNRLKMLFTKKSKYEAEYEENMVDSLGAMIIIGMILLLISLMSLVLGLLGSVMKNTAYTQVVNLIKKKLYWNSYIRYSLQSYLKFVFVCFAGLRTLSWDADWFDYARSTGILFACIALVLLPIVYGFLLRNKHKLNHHKVK